MTTHTELGDAGGGLGRFENCPVCKGRRYIDPHPELRSLALSLGIPIA
jgi:hypothetical protein